jgi:hypothetical protein
MEVCAQRHGPATLRAVRVLVPIRGGRADLRVPLYGFWRRENLLPYAQFEPQSIQLVTNRSSGYGIHSKVKTKLMVTACHAYVSTAGALVGIEPTHAQPRARWRWAVNSTSRPLYPVLIVQEAG